MLNIMNFWGKNFFVIPFPLMAKPLRHRSPWHDMTIDQFPWFKVCLLDLNFSCQIWSIFKTKVIPSGLIIYGSHLLFYPFPSSSHTFFVFIDWHVFLSIHADRAQLVLECTFRCFTHLCEVKHFLIEAV